MHLATRTMHNDQPSLYGLQSTTSPLITTEDQPMLAANATFEVREELIQISMLLDVLKLSLEGLGNEAHYFMASMLKDRLEKAMADLSSNR